MMFLTNSNVIFCRNLIPHARSIGRFCQNRGFSNRCTVSSVSRFSNSATTTTIDSTPAKIEASANDQSDGKLRTIFRQFLENNSLAKREAKSLDLALMASARRLYMKCGNVDFLKFITAFKMPDTIESWFVITGLHVWFVLLRLRQESDVQTEGFDQFRDAIMDTLWIDVKRRLEAISRTDKFISKKTIREETTRYYSYLTTSMIELDEGIMGDDKTLAGSLWRLFYKSKDMDDVEVLNRLVRYVRYQVNGLNERSVEDMITTGIKDWTYPKD